MYEAKVAESYSSSQLGGQPIIDLEELNERM